MKRVIFALLYDRGSYMLSRNFRRQRVGDLGWVLDNYRLLEVSAGLDELMVLNVGDGARIDDRFVDDVHRLSVSCFLPLTVGGGVRGLEDAERLLQVGVDKVLVNSPLVTDPGLTERLAARFGHQFVIAGIDVTSGDGRFAVVDRGHIDVLSPLAQRVIQAQEAGAGEVLIQSIDRDGTGMGLDLSVADAVAGHMTVPLIMMGGVGRSTHILEGLRHPDIDAVATANLFNFVGDSFVRARNELLLAGVAIPRWSAADLLALRASVSDPRVSDAIGSRES